MLEEGGSPSLLCTLARSTAAAADLGRPDVRCLGMSEAVAGDIRRSCGSRYSTGVSDVIVLHTVKECARQSVTVNEEILP